MPPLAAVAEVESRYEQSSSFMDSRRAYTDSKVSLPDSLKVGHTRVYSRKFRFYKSEQIDSSESSDELMQEKNLSDDHDIK